MGTTGGRTYTYRTWLSWSGQRGELDAAARAPLPVALPTEFGGPGDQWSPEELLVGATETCMMATFTALARRRGLELASCRSSATGTLGRTDAGFAFTSITISLQIRVYTEEARARAAALVEDAHRACFVAGSLRCPVSVDHTVELDEQPAQPHP
jgi:peroxiredoxin-like protein